MTEKKLRSVIYCRCSTEEESQKDALTKQVAEAKECVRLKGWSLVDSYVESRSGTSTKGRREYNRLLEELLLDKFDVIVIKSQDRLMRNTKDWYIFVDRLVKAQKKLYMYLEHKFYSPDDGLITGIKAILAEDYSRELSKKINNAHHNRQKNNGPAILTSNTYGYRKLPDKSVVLHPQEALVKRRMYELCANGYGSCRIADILKREGITNRKGNPFLASDIRRMIRNPLNKGTVVMNRKHYDFAAKKTVSMPREEYFVYENKVPAIVSPELWERANREIDKRKNNRNTNEGVTRGRNPGKGIFTGKLVCGLCGKPYYRTVRRSGKNGKKIYEWKCRSYLEAGKKGCANIALREENLYLILEQWVVIEQQDRQKITAKMLDMLKMVLKEKDYETEIEKEKKKKDNIGQQISALVDKLLEGVLSDLVYREKEKELKEKYEAAQRNLQELEKQKNQDNGKNERLDEIEEYLKEGDGISKAGVAEMLEHVEKLVIYPGYMEAVPLCTISHGAPEQRSISYGTTFQYLEQKRQERERIVSMMKENPKITAPQIAGKLGCSLSGTNYKLRVLKKEGRIHFQGSGGKGYWEVRE